MGQSRRNLELKVRCTAEELAGRRALLADVGVPVVARLAQRDVYFRVPAGRLKLRRIVENRDGVSRAAAELIRYERPDEAASRWSTYSVQDVPLRDAAGLESRLAAELGVAVVVAKVRDLALWGATRIHLDEVEGLGRFIELETVIAGQPEADALREHQTVIQALRLDELPAVAGSYSDLAMGVRVR